MAAVKGSRDLEGAFRRNRRNRRNRRSLATLTEFLRWVCNGVQEVSSGCLQCEFNLMSSVEPNGTQVSGHNCGNLFILKPKIDLVLKYLAIARVSLRRASKFKSERINGICTRRQDENFHHESQNFWLRSNELFKALGPEFKATLSRRPLDRKRKTQIRTSKSINRSAFVFLNAFRFTRFVIFSEEQKVHSSNSGHQFHWAPSKAFKSTWVTHTNKLEM